MRRTRQLLAEVEPDGSTLMPLDERMNRPVEFERVCFFDGAHVRGSDADIHTESVWVPRREGPDKWGEYRLGGYTVQARGWTCPSCGRFNALEPIYDEYFGGGRRRA